MVTSYQAYSLKEALEIRKAHQVVPYAGGTDLMVEALEDVSYLFLNKIDELKHITEDDEYIHFGAACTFTKVWENSLTPQILKDAISQIAAPAIRNAGTVGGNVCNGSPKADSALIFFVTGCKLKLVKMDGENIVTRILPIEEFYLGRNKTALQQDEILSDILMPKRDYSNYYYRKVGARNALAISRLSFAAIFEIENNTITRFSTAYGAIGSVILTLKEIDASLVGKNIEQAKAFKEELLVEYSKAINPIRGRISAEYRKAVCMNLLRSCLDTHIC